MSVNKNSKVLVTEILSKNCYCLDRHGGLKDVDISIGANFTKTKDLIWIRLTPREVKPFFEKFLPDEPDFVKDSLSALETRPRVLVYKDALLATFRGINLNKKSAPEDMISVRLWMKDNIIISVQRRSLSSINNILDNLKQGAGPVSSADFLEDLLAELIDKTSETIKELDDQLDKIEDHILSIKNADRINLNVIRRRVIVLRRYLIPQRDAINRIPVDKISWLDEKNLAHLREIADSCTRVVEYLNAEYERANIIHEELFALVQENINKKMYILSIVAIIFMPLTFITGLLGINVNGIPGAGYKYAFLIVCLIIFIISCCQIVYFRIKKWL
ncbi:CorA family divalent cation transporter [Francisella frigiditurris]|uniref:CorA-like Mg2+ transporter family protein n=1 Tax=Francisella frigiditurris TaxID=1542390 RepID=A0A1J0KV22_9GAMM|nr:CorA family divalent cation transporter [Francisella frigiditurris]APC97527.1 corA-like Mg2+ transporter family protein [Francisella frigiditurris]